MARLGVRWANFCFVENLAVGWLLSGSSYWYNFYLPSILSNSMNSLVCDFFMWNRMIITYNEFTNFSTKFQSMLNMSQEHS